MLPCNQFPAPFPLARQPFAIIGAQVGVSALLSFFTVLSVFSVFRLTLFPGNGRKL
jgi:hypothetical protein